MEERERLWGLEEVAAYLALPPSSVYKMTSAKRGALIPHLKLGGRLRFRKADIDRWLDLLSVGNLPALEKAKRVAGGR
ncbi:MAG TPA: helix-turn-helix domain-containing protein [Thermoanaerobaculia bacterium]|nr:helix-turn-helix domain-containing protein [Thermoanaerobaculia bacterium]